jgi:hypothetical protein
MVADMRLEVNNASTRWKTEPRSALLWVRSFPLDWAALVFVSLGSRLWLIATYSSPVPILDAWDGEGASLFKLWLQGSLTLADIFRPQNEHRVVPSKALAMLLLWLNGRDGRLELVANAILCCIFAIVIAIALIRLFGPGHRLLILVAIALWSGLPYGRENTLWSFQSAFYFLIFFSLLSI